MNDRGLARTKARLLSFGRLGVGLGKDRSSLTQQGGETLKAAAKQHGGAMGYRGGLKGFCCAVVEPMEPPMEQSWVYRDTVGGSLQSTHAVTFSAEPSAVCWLQSSRPNVRGLHPRQTLNHQVCTGFNGELPTDK